MMIEHSGSLPAKEGRALAIDELNGVIVIAVVFRPLGSEALSVISFWATETSTLSAVDVWARASSLSVALACLVARDLPPCGLPAPGRIPPRFDFI